MGRLREANPHFGFCILALGTGSVIDVLTYERRWTRRRLRAGGSKSARIELYEDHIFLRTNRSEGSYRLPGFVDVTATDRGVFLYPQKDISFYIPWASIEPAEAIPKVRELLLFKGRLGA